MHSSIIIFACFIYLKSLSVLSLRLFRTFLYSLSRNGAMFQMFLTFELPKLTFSCCDGCGFTSRSLQIGTISFIMHCNILILISVKTWNVYPEIFQLFSSFRNFLAILLLRTVILQNIVAGCPEFCKDSRFEDHDIKQDRNGPIINLDVSAKSASRIFLFYERFLLLENVYFFSFLFFSKSGGPCQSFSVERGFCIPCLSGISEYLSSIPDSKALDSGYHEQNFPGFWILQARISQILEFGYPYMGRSTSQTFSDMFTHI